MCGVEVYDMGDFLVYFSFDVGGRGVVFGVVKFGRGYIYYECDVVDEDLDDDDFYVDIDDEFEEDY